LTEKTPSYDVWLSGSGLFDKRRNEFFVVRGSLFVLRDSNGCRTEDATAEKSIVFVPGKTLPVSAGCD
ncbi:4738_t:CDS:2, partial [Ambispora leptoticha]